MNTTSKVLSVSEGKSMIYLIPGVLLITAAVAFASFIPFLSILLVCIALVLFSASTGLEIDVEQMAYRKYINSFGVKSGSWSKLTEVKEFHLRLAVESMTIRGVIAPAGNWNNTSRQSKSITYDLCYIDLLGENVIIFEFQDYDLARKMLKQLRSTEKFEIIDHIAIKLQENREKRANRR